METIGKPEALNAEPLTLNPTLALNNLPFLGFLIMISLYKSLKGRLFRVKVKLNTTPKP